MKSRINKQSRQDLMEGIWQRYAGALKQLKARILGRVRKVPWVAQETRYPRSWLQRSAHRGRASSHQAHPRLSCQGTDVCAPGGT